LCGGLFLAFTTYCPCVINNFISSKTKNPNEKDDFFKKVPFILIKAIIHSFSYLLLKNIKEEKLRCFAKTKFEDVAKCLEQ
jgi:transcription elongation factor GreA-like protein